MEELEKIAKKYGGTFAKFHTGGGGVFTYFYIISDVLKENREEFEKELEKKKYYVNEFYYKEKDKIVRGSDEII